jgi:hypothetical protein
LTNIRLYDIIYTVKRQESAPEQKNNPNPTGNRTAGEQGDARGRGTRGEGESHQIRRQSQDAEPHRKRDGRGGAHKGETMFYAIWDSKDGSIEFNCPKMVAKQLGKDKRYITVAHRKNKDAAVHKIMDILGDRGVEWEYAKDPVSLMVTLKV